MTTTSVQKPARGPRTRFRRRWAGAMALGLGLLTAGSLYTALSPQPQLATAQGDAAQVAKGQQLYNNA
jgi:ubiquinol-cytochrome c reductase cytochrome c subunit